ncbi:HEXXH motif-containing putative peptide modification protein [Streptomyces sp. PmtG]
MSSRRWSEAEIRVADGATVVRGESARVRLPRALRERAPGWHPLPVLWEEGRDAAAAPRPDAAAAPRPDAAAALRLDTVTPYRDFQVSPRAPARISGRWSRLWRHRVAAACALLARECPVDALALSALLRVLVPRGFDVPVRGPVASSSSADSFGAVTLSLPYDEVQLAAALVHETRHQQLNALLVLVPLVRAVEGGARRLYFAPWRSDPRPAYGTLHGVFAFSGVARFWRTHRGFVAGAEARRADFEFAVLREQVREAVAALLAGGELTPPGRLFVQEVEAVAEGWRKDEVAPGAARLAAHYGALRRVVWRARHREADGAQVRRCAAAWVAGRGAPALPSYRLRPRPGALRTHVFGHVARLYLAAPEDFAGCRSGAVAEGDVALAAECAAVAGDAEEAARRYAQWAAGDPDDVEAWIGAALAAPDRSAAAELLLDRPEAVAAVRRAVADAGAGPPPPLELAAWLGGSG